MSGGAALAPASVGLARTPRDPVVGFVAETLWRRVAFGVYPVDERLPSERDLAAELDVSRVTLRHAIRLLNERGVLETRHGRYGGSVVRALLPPPEQLEVLAVDIRESYAFRRVVEPAAARLSAEHADRRARARIAEAAAAPLDETYGQYRVGDSRFHLAIAEACGNRYLLDAIRTSRSGFYLWADAVWLMQDFERDVRPAIHGAEEHHRVIAAAVARRDPDAAERAMAAHIDESATTGTRALRRIMRRRAAESRDANEGAP